MKTENPIQTEEDLQRFIELMRSSILLSHLAFTLWDEIAIQATNNEDEFNDLTTLSSLLGHHQRLYYGTMVSELAKIYDSHQNSFSYRNALKFIKKNYPQQIDENKLNAIKGLANSIENEIKALMKTRNQYIAHNDRIRKDRKAGKGISIDNLEKIINVSKEIYQNLASTDEASDSLYLERSSETGIFADMIERYLQNFR